MLTTSVDTGKDFVGTSKDDEFVANKGTWGVADKIDGGKGTDGLTIVTNAVADLDFSVNTMKSIEIVNITSSDAANDIDLDTTIAGKIADNFKDVTDLYVTASDSASIDLTVDGKTNVTATTKKTAETIDVTGGKVVNATATSGKVTIKGDALTTVTVKGGTAASTVENTVDGAGVAGETLKSVSLEGMTGATATVKGNAIDTLTLKDQITALATTITNTKSTALTVNLNNVNTVTSTVDTGLGSKAETITINSNGTKDNKLDINAAAGKTLNITGDAKLTLDDASNAKDVVSTNTKGVTINGGALATDVKFTGGTGADTVTVGATTKAITMGAGDDVVTVNAALGTNGTVSGGDGVDTLSMTSALATTLSLNDTFSKAVDGFEKISIGAVAANTIDTVKLNNLDNIDYVVSAGTAAGGTNETDTITFNALLAGTSITIAGLTVTATSGDATAAQVAAAFAGGTTGTFAPLTVTGALASWTTAAAAGNSVIFTSTTVGDVVGLTPTFTAVAAPVVPSVSTTNGVAATSTETADVTFTNLLIGQSVTIDGRTVTAKTGDALAADVATAFATGATAGTLIVADAAGALASWTPAVAAVGNSVLFTSNTANTDIIPNLLPAVDGTLATTVSNAPFAGTAGSALEIESMTNNGTLELTGVIAGSTTVKMKDATGTADTLNIKLNGIANTVNTGTLTVAGVETINITATDSSVDTVTLANPGAASKINLVAVDATKIVVAGNHGVNFTGSTLTKVTTLDASGVVATGATATATAAQIATAGAVTFTSVVTDKAVTVTTGNGNDTINLASVNDATKGSSTVTTGAGDDIITGTAGKDVINAGDGKDTITGGAGADTLTGGAGNDKFVITLATDSTLAAKDIITDFQANTYGQGANGASTVAGANATATNWTGDVIDLTFATPTNIELLVVSNAADAQTFIQNAFSSATYAAVNIALDSSTGNLYIDTDNNGTIDSVLQLTGVTTITEAAFVI